jgi:hypothetical protein
VHRRRTRQGGVESRSKAIRLAHLTPIPHGDSLDAISRQLLGDLDATFAARHDGGRPRSELWAQERARLLPVPWRWVRLNATAYLGVDDVRITCMGESVTHPRAVRNSPGPLSSLSS